METFKEKLIRDLKRKELSCLVNFPFKLMWNDGWYVVDGAGDYVDDFDDAEFDKAYDFLMSLED